MATTRILDADHQLLQGLAKQTGKQHQQIIHEALTHFHRELMLDDINAAFAALKRDRTAWGDEASELAAWDAAVADGLADE